MGLIFMSEKRQQSGKPIYIRMNVSNVSFDRKNEEWVIECINQALHSSLTVSSETFVPAVGEEVEVILRWHKGCKRRKEA